MTQLDAQTRSDAHVFIGRLPSKDLYTCFTAHPISCRYFTQMIVYQVVCSSIKVTTLAKRRAEKYAKPHLSCGRDGVRAHIFVNSMFHDKCFLWSGKCCTYVNRVAAPTEVWPRSCKPDASVSFKTQQRPCTRLLCLNHQSSLPQPKRASGRRRRLKQNCLHRTSRGKCDSVDALCA